MTIWTILGFISDLLKLEALADYFYARHKARVYAQSEANTPSTLKELQDEQRSGDF